MSGITRFALTHQRLTYLVIGLVSLIGLLTYLSFPSREDPQLTIREAIVSAANPGMPPARVKDLITRPLEEAIRRLPEVEHITSTSTVGRSLIHVRVRDSEFELKPIWQDLRNEVEAVRPNLPDGTSGPKVDDDFGDVAIATIAIVADGFELREIREIAREVRDRLYGVNGVKQVELHGLQPERVYLEASNARLAQFGLSPSLLLETLRGQNIVLPGGRVQTGVRDLVVDPTGDFASVEDIAQVVLRLPGEDQLVYLQDIMQVRRAPEDPPDRLAYFNGEPAVIVSVAMQSGQNVLEFGPRLRDAVAAIENAQPVGVTLDFATYQPEAVERAVDGVAINLYQTLAIVLGVVIVFLGLRTGLIVGAMVPLTILASLIVMRIVGIELQRVSLASLIISLGLIVDNGIVVGEDIRRRLGEGATRAQAAIETGRELALPLLTSTLTTILAFTPLLLAQNAAGEYTRSLSLVVLITLLASWMLALTATPLLCSRFMRRPGTRADTGAGRRSRFAHAYRGALATVLRFRVPFLLLMLLVLAAAVVLMRQVPRQFFPESDRDQFMVQLDVPAGYSIHRTDENVRRLVEWLGEQSEIEKTVAYVGFGGPRFFLTIAPIDPAPHVAFLVADLHEAGDVDTLIERTRARVLNAHPEARARVKPMYLGNVETGLVELRLSGHDAERLMADAKHAERIFDSVSGTLDLLNDWRNPVVKVVVRVDQARARRAGISSEEIATTLSGFFSGNAITDYREGDTVIPVVLRAQDAERSNLDQLRTVTVYPRDGGTGVPLLQIADFESSVQFSTIARRDLKRTVTVSAKHSTLTAAKFEDRLEPLLAPILGDLPPNHEWEWGGETEGSQKARSALFSSAPLCVGVIVVLLVWQFNSFRRPLVILLTIPLAFVGGIVGLYLTGSKFGFMAVMGFFSLAGIIINNAIVLLDRIDLEVAGGASPYEAILNASEQRLKPILVTTLTTVLGLLPLILSEDVLFFDMANVIAFGLAGGTVMTLGVAPVLYSILFRVRRFPDDQSVTAGTDNSVTG